MLKFVTVQTRYNTSSNTFEERNVTLAHDTRTGKVSLLGGINHGNEIIINQELVNALQEIVNNSNK